ncbi:Peptidyl-prolyl cis-trans isomerase D [uncultured bacterium]|nr:Peptidyl-prolyl cis-trans isomerase D [uncultured bacterium]
MLSKIREKSHSTIAQGILLGISALFGLWGINSYTSGPSEAVVATVGGRDFYQRDLAKAYEQYAGQLRGMGIDEQTLKDQALSKLIKDEVLLQYAVKQGLAATDDNTRDFIKSLPYFQIEGKFNEGQYKAMLNSQRLTSQEFTNKIRDVLVMQQVQDSIVGSSFATDYDIESFFKIQNQQRDFDYVTVTIPTLTEQPSDSEIADYYKQHQDLYKTPEQMSVEYVELSLNDLAKKVEVSDEKVKAYYEEQKANFTTPERRKISHILFKVDDKTDEKTALEKALKAKQQLANKDFATLAKEISEDKLTAKTGGDLGVFDTGAMEKPFEQAVANLKLNEVSEPVKTAFGYHLIKVTELIASNVKPYDVIKDEVTKAYQKSQAENAFYQAGETLTNMSFEHPDSLQAVADALGLTIKKSELFSREQGKDIASEDKIRATAFSEEVLQGNNSSPIELGSDRLVVLRQLEHKEAAVKELKEVKAQISATILLDKAKLQTVSKAKEIADKLRAGEKIDTIAKDQKLEVKKVSGLTRNKTEQLSPQLADAVFKVAKPVKDKPSISIVPLATGEQVVLSLNKVTVGSMSEDDKKKMALAKKNIAYALGNSEFDSVLNNIQANTKIKVNPKVAEPAAQ